VQTVNLATRGPGFAGMARTMGITAETTETKKKACQDWQLGVGMFPKKGAMKRTQEEKEKKAVDNLAPANRGETSKKQEKGKGSSSKSVHHHLQRKFRVKCPFRLPGRRKKGGGVKQRNNGDLGTLKVGAKCK